MECPLCGRTAKTERGLVKHLAGELRNGGHRRSQDEAERMAADSSSGACPQPIARANTAPVRFSTKERKSFTFAVLERLVANKQLPKYEFERAIDGVLAVFLPGILSETLGGRYRLVAQEFPLKKDVGYQSTNVDYVLFRDAEPSVQDRWIFLELKTDPRSTRTIQDSIYAKVLSANPSFRSLWDQAHEVAKRSRARGKYQALFDRFDGLPLDRPIQMIYLVPTAYTPDGFAAPVEVIDFAQLHDLELETFPAEWRLFRDLVLPALARG